MNPVDLLSSNSWSHLAQALLHSLWQGAFIAGLLYLHLRSVPANRPQLRYAGTVGALLAFVVTCFMTWAFLEHEPPQRAMITPNSGAAEVVDSQTTFAPNTEPSESGHSTSNLDQESSSNDNLQGILLLLWIIGIDIMLIRLSLSLANMKDLEDRASVPQDSEIQSRFLALLSRTQTRQKPLRLLVADHLPGPVAFGFLRPTIILPLSLATRTPADLIDAILAHELAHIRRHDYVVNLGQHLIETLFFFNPAVWWMSHQIRTEREACCDSEAVRLLGCDTQYANALTDYAVAQKLPTTALPFGHEKRPGSLIERIRRILVPDYRPTLKLPVPALTLFILVSSLILLALHQGSRVAVAVGAELLSPEARIAQIRTIQETHPTRDPELQMDETKARLPESRVTISGQIQTHDGSPLNAERLQVTAVSERPNYSASYTVNRRGDKFDERVQPGEIHLAAYSPHYAPALLGPLHGGISTAITNLSLEMKPGFLGRIQVIDPAGEIIPDAHFSGAYEFPSHVPVKSSQTNAQGFGYITNAIAHPVKLTIRAPGFEEDYQTVTLHPDRPVKCLLQPATLSTIIVQDSDGNGIKGAAAKLAGMRGARNISFGHESRKVVARAGVDGVITFDELRSDAKYWFVIEAEGYGKVLVDNVTAGEQDRVITLGTPYSVHGTLRGDFTLLKERSRWIDGKLERFLSIRYQNPVQILSYSDSHMTTLPIEVDGDEAHFEIPDLWPGTIKVEAGLQTFTRDLKPGDNALEITLTDPPPSAVATKELLEPLPERVVDITFEIPENHPLPSGSLKTVLSLKQPEGGFDYEDRQLSLEQGKAQVTVPVGSTVRVEPDDFTGYWFRTHYERDIPDGERPLPIHLACFPAGAIYGSVTESNGDPARGIMISIVECERATGRPNTGLDLEIKSSSSSSDITKQYTATPLPIGGTYMIVVHRNTTYALSKQIKITPENPIVRADITLQPGLTVRGRILRPDGSPAKGLRYTHSFSAHATHGFSSGENFTDRLGRFEFTDVVPDIGLSYGIEVHHNPGYQKQEIRYQPDGTELEIVLEAGRSYQGTVVDQETGWPIPGAEVYALPHPYSRSRTGHIDADEKTDGKGTFQFTTLDDGEYQLGIRGARFSSADAPIVRAGDGRTATLRVMLPEWSQLSPKEPKATTP